MVQKRTYIFISIIYLFVTSSIIPDTVLESSPIVTEKDSINISTLLDSCWSMRTSAPNQALEFGQRALRVIDSKKYIELKPKTLNYLGVVHRKLGNLKESHNYFIQALDLANLLKDSIQIGYTYNNLTDYYIKKASYTQALENVLIGYQIFEKLNNKKGMAYSLNYLGEIYILHGDYEKALSYLNEAAKLRLEFNDLRGYSKTTTNIGVICFRQNELDSAEFYYMKSLNINNKIRYYKGKSRVLSLLGDIHIKNKLYKRANKNIGAALRIDREIKNKAGEITNLNKLGSLYLTLGKFDLAKSHFYNALKFANESEHLDQEMVSYLNLSNYYSSVHNFSKAYNYLNKYMAIKDSIYSHERMGRFANLQTIFATSRKEIENKLLKNEIDYKTRNNQFLIAFFIVTLIIIILLVSKFRAQNKANNLLKELNSSKDKFFSILAHDLKNPFQALMGYTNMLHDDFDDFSKEEIKTSIESLKNISHNVYNLLEGLLEWSRAQTGRMEYNPTLFELSEETKLVVALYNENANVKRIQLSSEIDDSINIFADRNMINTILRNLVGNAIKFTKQNGSVKILAKKDNNNIKIIVTDTGLGMSSEVVESLFKIDIHHSTLGTDGEVGTGVGLMLCYELVKYNKGNIWVESELGKGSKFIFTLPISQK